MQKAPFSDDGVADATMEDSSTSLAPTILYLTTLGATPATEESLVLPSTALWPQVRGDQTVRGWGGVLPAIVRALAIFRGPGLGTVITEAG